MKIVKCPICNKEFSKGKRALHAHMMKDHLEAYREKGCKLEAFGIKPEPVKKTEPPEDFRPLDLSDSLEKAAYQAGYRYYAGEECYTSAECKKLGWI